MSRRENIHSGRPTNTLLLVLQTTFWMAPNAGILFHSECSRDQCEENRREERHLTIASEIQNLIKGCDDLVSDLRVHLSNIPSKLRANNRNMIGGVVELVSQRITSVR